MLVYPLAPFLQEAEQPRSERWHVLNEFMETQANYVLKLTILDVCGRVCFQPASLTTPLYLMDACSHACAACRDGCLLDPCGLSDRRCSSSTPASDSVTHTPAREKQEIKGQFNNEFKYDANCIFHNIGKLRVVNQALAESLKNIVESFEENEPSNLADVLLNVCREVVMFGRIVPCLCTMARVRVRSRDGLVKKFEEKEHFNFERLSMCYGFARVRTHEVLACSRHCQGRCPRKRTWKELTISNECFLCRVGGPVWYAQGVPGQPRARCRAHGEEEERLPGI